jgi:hypothetical protein
VWSEAWQPPEEWLRRLEGGLAAEGAVSQRGGEFDRWDLEVRGGTLAGVRIAAAVEEHGSGRQLVRFRLRPRWTRDGLVVIAALVGMCGGAAAAGAWVAAVLLGLVAAGLTARTVQEGAAATGVSMRAIAGLDPYRSEREP